MLGPVEPRAELFRKPGATDGAAGLGQLLRPQQEKQETVLPHRHRLRPGDLYGARLYG
jgi:hypothetical protein